MGDGLSRDLRTGLGSHKAVPQFPRQDSRFSLYFFFRMTFGPCTSSPFPFPPLLPKIRVSQPGCAANRAQYVLAVRACCFSVFAATYSPPLPPFSLGREFCRRGFFFFQNKTDLLIVRGRTQIHLFTRGFVFQERGMLSVIALAL